MLKWKRPVKRAAERMDSDTTARMKRWRQGLDFPQNPAAVGDSGPRESRASSRLSGSGARGLSVPLMLLASYCSAKLPFGFSTRKIRPDQIARKATRTSDLLSRTLFGRR